ncbi:MAG: DUF5320 domain-containing protein [Thermodesulfobacteriota bacterium]|nr:DUF5320 domain-containing protein [Thermodesulfobacteriota bacterium]
MPGYDRSGPLGEGPRTGRGLGRCGNRSGTQRSDGGPGRGARQDDGTPLGQGFGRGGSRGRGRNRGRRVRGR